jgi:hypothetical protein
MTPSSTSRGTGIREKPSSVILYHHLHFEVPSGFLRIRRIEGVPSSVGPARQSFVRAGSRKMGKEGAAAREEERGDAPSQ